MGERGVYVRNGRLRNNINMLFVLFLGVGDVSKWEITKYSKFFFFFAFVFFLEGGGVVRGYQRLLWLKDFNVIKFASSKLRKYIIHVVYLYVYDRLNCSIFEFS